MEGEVVAPSVFFDRKSMPGPSIGRKRDFSVRNQGIEQQRAMGDDSRNSNGNWNPKMWNWDSLTFTAKPVSSPVDALRPGAQSQSEKGAVLNVENLSLKLGGGGGVSKEEVGITRANKRVRSGSPGNGGNYPVCQVDECGISLSGAKDYHRRHKVCEVHSKASQAVVGKQLQRFCQQCSRFHPLAEFDEGKRSCRRRLAGHNRRRRKTQPDDVPSRILLPENQLAASAGNLDIISVLSWFARLQGNVEGKPTSIPLPDKDRLVLLLSKLNTENNANNLSRVPVAGGFDLNVSAPQVGLVEQLQKASAHTTPTLNLMEALSAAISASSAEALASVSQGSSENSGNDKTKDPNVEIVTDVNSHNKVAQIFPTAALGQRSYTSHSISYSPAEVAQPPVRESRSSLPLHLFGSSDDGSPPKVGSPVKYMSSESSNLVEERSPSSSPPVTHKLFPLHSTTECLKNARESSCREESRAVELSTSLGWNTPMDLFQKSERQVEHTAAQRIPYQAGYTSSSSSDHSPSSSNSDARDRTGRIIFKLFGKDPSCLNATLRPDIMNWLSNSPSEMESHIRPGCVVLSVYISMSSIAWKELEEDLRQRVITLVQTSGSDFWRNERFLVHTSRQLVSHKDGKFRLSKSWGTWGAPELLSVSPIAVVGGQETSLVLKGRNFAVPGTKIYCTHMGKYISKEVCTSYPGTIYDDSSIEKFVFPGGMSKVYGRCFIEVENNFKGNSFPLIIANADICQELRVLESYFEEDISVAYGISEEVVQDNRRPHSREDVIHFLNELGWLFQKTNDSLDMLSLDFSCARFKYLFLFSVERDWCVLTKSLLDILANRSMKTDALQKEALEMLSEIHLLNRAVKRKCRKMVDLLLVYSVRHANEATIFLFPPDMAGPGGVTPLHLAASARDSEHIVDALTNDPQEIGLKSWSSLQDDSAQSPYMYAVARNNHSYNKLVARKITDRENGQVTISFEDEEISINKLNAEESEKPTSQIRSCAQCALAGQTKHRVAPRRKGLLQWPYVHSLLAIAAVCCCVAVLMRGLSRFGVEPFKWDEIHYGSM